MSQTQTNKIANIEDKIAQLENQRKQLIQKQKTAERKARTKRLCQRMGLFESMLPDSISLTDEQFKAFLEKTTANDFGRRTLAKLTTQGAPAAPSNEGGNTRSGV